MNKKRIITRLLVTVCIAIMLACSIAVIPASAQTGTTVKVKVGKKTFNAVFYDNKTSAALLKKLPVSYKMSELNGNEKYKYLKYDLPTDEKHVKKVKAGDIMLYGSDCLVVFYKSFNTSYDYTRVGRITNTKGLKRALGKGSVKISFSKKKVIALNRKTLSLTTGEKSTLKLKGAKASKVKWTTSNKTIAAASKKGVVTAKKNGTATITAKYNNKKYKCKVTVR
jgi:hypothetical protein